MALCVVKTIDNEGYIEYLGRELYQDWYEEGNHLEIRLNSLDNFLGSESDGLLTIFKSEIDAQNFIDSHSWTFNFRDYEIIPLSKLETT